MTHPKANADLAHGEVLDLMQPMEIRPGTQQEMAGQGDRVLNQRDRLGVRMRSNRGSKNKQTRTPCGSVDRLQGDADVFPAYRDSSQQ